LSHEEVVFAGYDSGGKEAGRGGLEIMTKDNAEFKKKQKDMKNVTLSSVLRPFTPPVCYTEFGLAGKARNMKRNAEVAKNRHPRPKSVPNAVCSCHYSTAFLGRWTEEQLTEVRDAGGIVSNSIFHIGMVRHVRYLVDNIAIILFYCATTVEDVSHTEDTLRKIFTEDFEMSEAITEIIDRLRGKILSCISAQSNYQARLKK